MDESHACTDDASCGRWSIFMNSGKFTLSVRMLEHMKMPDPQIEQLVDLIQRTGAPHPLDDW